jgi:ABC-type hemin transport system ATPase subunit
VNLTSPLLRASKTSEASEKPREIQVAVGEICGLFFREEMSMSQFLYATLILKVRVHMQNDDYNIVVILHMDLNLISKYC